MKSPDIILEGLNRQKGKIIDELSRHQWSHFKDYFEIREKFLKNEIDDEFKKTFRRLYKMDGRLLNDKQQNRFFKMLADKENDLGKILNGLYEIPSPNGKHNLFLSFGTKLLHTLDNKSPIYDNHIGHVLGFNKHECAGTLNIKIKNRIEIYEELKMDSQSLFSHPEIYIYLTDMRTKLSIKAIRDSFEWKDDLINNTKLLDSALWMLDQIIERPVKLKNHHEPPKLL